MYLLPGQRHVNHLVKDDGSLPDGNQSCLETQRVFLGPRVLSQLRGDPGPVAQDGHGVVVQLAVVIADAGEVDLADKVDGRGFSGIVGAALHLELVDAVLVIAMGRPPNGAPPVRHEDVLGVLEAVRAGTCITECLSGHLP